MEITTTWTAIRKDRAVPAAHCGTAVLATASAKQLGAPMGTFVGVPSTYVAGQESNPPREESG